MCLSSEIKLIRQKCMLSQQAFAKELGVSFATINRLESGKTTPSYKTMKLIDDYCRQHSIDFDVTQILLDMNGE